MADRASALEALLGDAWQETNPTGFRALLAADEREDQLAAATEALDGFAFNRELVPTGLGGRLDSLEGLVATMRVLWRRDPCLGVGYAGSSYLAAVQVWVGGDESQRRAMADALSANRRFATAYNELEHGNDLTSAAFRATSGPDGWELHGRKDVVTNLGASDGMVLFARTSDRPGGRSHSLFLLPELDLASARLRSGPRYRSSGLRGVHLGGAEFLGYPVPAEALLGAPGQGLELGLRSFQVTRTTLPAMFLATAETGLRVTLTAAEERRLYGAPIVALPYVRASIARAAADLLAADALCAVAIRALHLLPKEAQLLAAAVKYLVPQLLKDVVDTLRMVLGAQSYLREGPAAIFQKLARDLAPIAFMHASRTACQAGLLPLLPRLAQRSWLGTDSAPGEAGLFRPGAPLPPMDFTALGLGIPWTDTVSATLAAVAEQPGGGLPTRFAAYFRDELARLRDDFTGLAPQDTTINASAAAFEAAHRYTVVLAAAACLGVWRHAGGGTGRGLGEDLWASAALDRLAARLPGRRPITAEERTELEDALFRQTADLHHAGRPLDLTGRPGNPDT
ncbi:acyl-CoA dehydrogenase [Streptomyces sp. NBC_00984]|uniref:acyl-CoA dehydrogenase n=1 Tax=Streptomyces sp. NBC_00984 TaxID=2903700 RepID=UPI00386EB1D7|nr:acyl-CoA dehydrogenase [Streptomyces sp. NBC_00984]